LELPLDHFRLIGVSPSATSEEILRAFQLRLDKTPEDGFTFEVLTQRSELLRLTADLLTNPEDRKQYEDLVLKGSSGLDFASNREVAGLILLWESGSPKEAFKLARKALQPPQTPALGSSREADLTLLAALASRDAAIKEQDQRCYANAADFLQEGIQILQRMGKLGELRKNLEDYLSALLPYRILDYLSRDLIDNETHTKGIGMLLNYINKRGGLEGKNNSENEKTLDQRNFEVFFQQVKSFLTVNEQINLFLNLYKKGSSEAGSLAFLALIAEGYAKKKPENLFEALKIIKNLNLPELDTMPILGCLDLLLANIESAENRFLVSSDENLKEWLNSYEGGKLDAICVYCKNWLENDVLKGFRDIQIDEVDLDSWFEDKGVKDFIEKSDKKSSYTFSGEYMRKLGNNFKKSTDESTYDLAINDDIQDQSNLPLPGGNKKELDYLFTDYLSKKDLIKNKSVEIFQNLNEFYSELKFLIGELLKSNKFTNKSKNIIYLNVFLVLFVFGIGLSFLRNSSKNLEEETIPVKTLKNETNYLDSKNINFQESREKSTDKNIIKEIKRNGKINEDPIPQSISLTSISPTITEIENLLKNWLESKSKFLAGKDDIDLSKIVQVDLIRRLNNDRASDIKNNITRIINTEILSLEYLSQSSSRISVLAKLKYSEKILNNNGEVLNTTTFNPFLKVKYIFGYTQRSWKLVEHTQLT